MITFGQSIATKPPNLERNKSNQKKHTQGEHHSVHQSMMKVPAFCFWDVYRRLIIFLWHVQLNWDVRYSETDGFKVSRVHPVAFGVRVHIHCPSPWYRNSTYSTQYRSRTCIFKHIQFHKQTIATNSTETSKFPTYPVWFSHELSRNFQKLTTFIQFLKFRAVFFQPKVQDLKTQRDYQVFSMSPWEQELGRQKMP